MKTTLQDTFKALRSDKRLTLADIGSKCDLDPTTVLKVESGKRVRWTTLHIILTAGMQVHPDTPGYQEIHNLWVDDQAVAADELSPENSKKKLSVHAAAAMRELREIVRPMGQRKLKLFMVGARRLVATAKPKAKK